MQSAVSQGGDLTARLKGIPTPHPSYTMLVLSYKLNGVPQEMEVLDLLFLWIPPHLVFVCVYIIVFVFVFVIVCMYV